MNYDELLQANKKLERQANLCYARQKRNREIYKRQNAPFPLRKNQRVSITLRVTKETREHLGMLDKRKKKWQEGNIYTVIGCIHDWFIDEEHGGRLLPALFRAPYSLYDEVLEIKIADEQFEGSCAGCRRHKDGLCFLAGGKNISKRCATGKAGEFTCQLYEEETELWSLDGKSHYPNVTYQRNGDRSYHIFNKDWTIYEKYGEKEVGKFFSITNPNI